MQWFLAIIVYRSWLVFRAAAELKHIGVKFMQACAAWPLLLFQHRSGGVSCVTCCPINRGNPDLRPGLVQGKRKGSLPDR